MLVDTSDAALEPVSSVQAVPSWFPPESPRSGDTAGPRGTQPVPRQGQSDNTCNANDGKAGNTWAHVAVLTGVNL